MDNLQVMFLILRNQYVFTEITDPEMPHKKLMIMIISAP